MRRPSKLVFRGFLLTAAVSIAIGFYWWSCYNATHHAAALWGRWNTWLIRDGYVVEFLELHRTIAPTSEVPSENTFSFHGRWYQVVARHDVSYMPEIARVRNALLDDKSFVWPAHRADRELPWRWVLEFTHEKEGTSIYFTHDCADVACAPWDASRWSDGLIVSSSPIAASLAETMSNWSHLPATDR